MTTRGYSGLNYDRQLEHTHTSTLHKMKETYWTTKQAVIQKLGKKEDEHVVASDHELDTKLDVFRSIQTSSMELLRVIERYQDRLCVVSQEENAMGRFLKAQSSHDKTRAGKMMAAVGKSQSFAAQQRLALRVPLVRLYQEVETFRYRAISDTLVTINRMEGARTEYRGALLWMKNVSEELDPDTYKQLEKFRKVQGQVRKTKARFDKLKLDVMQKVDLLAASRCNMFSHVLANYQSTLLHFWEKTSRTMSAVAESFKGYQHYEFNMLKELTEPSRQLTNDEPQEEKSQKDNDFDPENENYEESEGSYDSQEEEGESEQRCEHRQHSSQTKPPHEPTEVDSVRKEKVCWYCGQLIPPSVQSGRVHQRHITKEDNSTFSKQDGDLVFGFERLLALDDEYKDDVDENNKENATDENLRNLALQRNTTAGNNVDKPNHAKKNEFEPFIEFDEDASDTLDFDIEKELSLTSRLGDKKDDKKSLQRGPQDLLSEELEPNDSEKDDMTLLNEILNAPSTGEDEFTQEWQAVFGSNPPHQSPAMTHTEPDLAKAPAQFMPSSLLDISSQMSAVNLGQVGAGPRMTSGVQQGATSAAAQAGSGAQPQQQQQKSKPQQPPSKKSQKTDMSAWFNLFADLDPLSDPDAIGRSENKESNAA